MEYMALGKPTVQFDLKEGRMAAKDASLYAKPNDAVDFGDKILELLDNPVRRQQMSEYGRRRVSSSLSWEHEAPKLLRAYETVFTLRKNKVPLLRRIQIRLGLKKNKTP